MLIRKGPSIIKTMSLNKSDTIPVLNIFRIVTAFEEYTIAIGGVVEGRALEIEAPSPAAIIDGMGLKPAPIARDAAIGHTITAEAVFDAAYDSKKAITALIANIPHSVESGPAFSEIRFPNRVARPLASIPRPSTKPPPKRNTIFQSIDFRISFQDNIGCHE